MKKLLWMLLSTCFVALVASCNKEELISGSIRTRSEGPVNSYVITMDQAKEELSGLMREMNYYYTRSGDIYELVTDSSYSIEVPYENQKTQKPESLTIHVINFRNNKGFALMAGDKRFPTLLALSQEGNLNPNDTIDNPGFATFISGIKPFVDNQALNFKWAFTGPEPNDGGELYVEYGDWITEVYPNEPLCPVKWGQDSIYNTYCKTSDGKPAKTGCVATAVAQLMASNKYPQGYNGYTFHWDQMTAHSDGDSCSEVGKDDIARLMQQLGLRSNLNMSYGEKESLASVKNIPRTLSSFGYTYHGSLSSYDIQKVITEIQKGQAVIMSGHCFKDEHKFLWWTRYSYRAGHAWLVDGAMKRTRLLYYYKENGELSYTSRQSYWYILCNWGWKGRRDGYYLGDVFDIIKGPDVPAPANSSGENSNNGDKDGIYQYNLQIITGIRK